MLENLYPAVEISLRSLVLPMIINLFMSFLVYAVGVFIFLKPKGGKSWTALAMHFAFLYAFMLLMFFALPFMIAVFS